MKRISRFVIALAALLLNGADSFTLRASDGLALSNIATVAIDITPVNAAPVAQSGVVKSLLCPVFACAVLIPCTATSAVTWGGRAIFTESELRDHSQKFGLA